MCIQNGTDLPKVGFDINVSKTIVNEFTSAKIFFSCEFSVIILTAFLSMLDMDSGLLAALF